MRILIINSEFPPVGGGAGNASDCLARELVKLRQEVVVATSAFENLPRHEVRAGVRILRVPAYRKRADRSGAFEQGAFIVVGSFAVLKFVRSWKPDAVLAFFGVPSGAVAWLLNVVSKVPYVVSLRGGDVPGFRPYDFGTYHKVIAPLLRQVWQRATAVVANSRGLQSLARAFNNHIPVQIISNGVDVQRFVVPVDRQWDPPRLLFVGRVVYQKGLDILLPVLTELKHLPWEFSVVGDGPQREMLEKVALKTGISDRIHFRGWQRGTGVEQQYRLANLFVFPSRHEGMPNAVLEAMASGLPVIATRIAGSEELVLPGETGQLVVPDDPSELKSALIPLLTNADMRREMGLAGRRRVEDNFTWNGVAKKYLDVLESAGRTS
jgi:glycogen(starch) synthase